MSTSVNNNKRMDEDDHDDIIVDMDISKSTGTFQGVKIGQSVIPSIALSKSQRDIKCHWCDLLPIFLPFGRFIFWWDTYLSLCLLYSVVEIPYTIAFHVVYHPSDFAAILSLLIDLSLVVDIVLCFRTAYIDKYDRLRIIHDPTLIAHRYLRSWFIIDVLSAMPFTYLLLVYTSTKGTEFLTYFRLLRILKLFRLVKLLQYFNRFRESVMHGGWDRRQTRTFFRLIRVIAIMLMCAHYFACLWYGIGSLAFERGKRSWIDVIVENDDIDAGKFHHYSYAFYWSITTLFTTGYGDIHATNLWEQWTCSFAIFVGSCFFAYFIGVLTTGLGDDLRHQHKRERIEESLSLCAQYNLPTELRRALLTHIRYYNSQNYLFDHEPIMRSLPYYLQNAIYRHLATSVLNSLDIMESLSPFVVGQIVLRMTAKSVGAGQMLYKKDDIGHELYIQRTGKSKLIDADTPNQVRILKRGEVFGEHAFLSRKRTETVVALVWSEFYALRVEDIAEVLHRNYDETTARNIWTKMKQTILSTKAEFAAAAQRSNEGLLESSDGCPPPPAYRHVRFKTIDMSGYQTYLAPETYSSEESLRATTHCDDGDASLRQQEHDLEMAEEQEQHRTVKRRPTFRSIKRMFLEKDKSISRNRKQGQHYAKLESAGNNNIYFYARKQLPQTAAIASMDADDVEVEANIIKEIPPRIDHDDVESVHSLQSAGFFDESKANVLSRNHVLMTEMTTLADDKSDCKQEEDEEEEEEEKEVSQQAAAIDEVVQDHCKQAMVITEEKTLTFDSHRMNDMPACQTDPKRSSSWS